MIANPFRYTEHKAISKYLNPRQKLYQGEKEEKLLAKTEKFPKVESDPKCSSTKNTSSMQILSRNAPVERMRWTSHCIVYQVSLNSSWQPFKQWMLGNIPQRISNNGKDQSLYIYLILFKREKLFLPEGIRGRLIKDTCKQNKCQKIFIINWYCPCLNANLQW